MWSKNNEPGFGKQKFHQDPPSLSLPCYSSYFSCLGPVWESKICGFKESAKFMVMHSLKLTAKASENGWLEDDPFLLGLFRAFAVSFRDCKLHGLLPNQQKGEEGKGWLFSIIGNRPGKVKTLIKLFWQYSLVVVTGLHATSFTITMALVGSILGSREPSLLHDDKRMDKKSCAVSNVDCRQTCQWMCHVVIWYGSNISVPTSALWVFFALGILDDLVRRVALNKWLSAACLEWKRGATGQLGSAKIKETTTIISEKTLRC